MSKAVFRLSERIYSFLLKFYPKSFRQEFGEEMQYVFSESLKVAFIENGEQGAIRFWSRTILDAGKSLVVQHVENLNGDAAMKTFMMQNKNIFLIALATAFILLVPMAAMQFANEVSWSLFDFVFAGTFLFGTGLAYELITRKWGTWAYRAAVGLALGTALLLFWSNLAVGVIGSEDNPANWMYIGVLAIFIIGALIARFRPQGMRRVLFATAIAQALTALIALVFVKDLDVFEIFAVNGFFAALWAGSALLFRHANAR